MISRWTDKTGDSPRTTGTSWKRTATAGGWSVSKKCQSTSTLTGLTTSSVSSVSGKSRCMPYTDYSDSSFPPSLWVGRKSKVTDSPFGKNIWFHIFMNPSSGKYSVRIPIMWNRLFCFLPKHPVFITWNRSSPPNGKWRVSLQERMMKTVFGFGMDYTLWSVMFFLYRTRKKKINIIRASEYNAISSSVHSMNRSRMRLTDCMISIIITATTSSGANRLWRNYRNWHNRHVCWFAEKTWVWFRIVFRPSWMIFVSSVWRFSGCQRIRCTSSDI